MDLLDITEIPDLNRWIADHNLASYWGREGGPLPEFTPFLWRWADIYDGLQQAAAAIPFDADGRRSIELLHPALSDRAPTTLSLAVHMLMPGEAAAAHRHSAAAVRFVVQGDVGAVTVVEGEPFPMETGDLITVPRWSWHDYAHHGSEPVIWLSGVDRRLSGLGHVRRERDSAGRQPITKPPGDSAVGARHAVPLRPAWSQPKHALTACRYPWKETDATLSVLKEYAREADPCDGISLAYTHPLTGGPTMPTFACGLQLLRPGIQLRPHRHNSTTFYQAVGGEGRTVVNDEPFEWSQGDIFVVPPWLWHKHESRSTEDAILFSITDRPALTAFGFYREEEEKGT